MIERLFERHDQLDDIERVRPQVVDERRFRNGLFLRHIPNCSTIKSVTRASKDIEGDPPSLGPDSDSKG